MFEASTILIALFLICQMDESSSDAIRVACIGDSLTFGHGLKNREQDCYPAQLAGKLGSRWKVKGFGVSGATLIQSGTRPYRDQPLCDDATRFEPDVVVLMLGTNDTNPQTWPAFHGDFRDDYLTLIGSFRDENPNTLLIVCLPPPLFRDRGKQYDTDRILVKEVIPQIREVARQTDAQVVDLYSKLENESERFSDGVHPDERGAEIMAEEIAITVRSLPIRAQRTERP